MSRNVILINLFGITKLTTVRRDYIHNKKRLLTAQCCLFCSTFTEAVKVHTVDDDATTTIIIIIIIIITIELLRDRAAANSGLPS